MKKYICLTSTLFLISLLASLSGQSIAEKKAALNTTGSDLDRETEQLLLQVNRETEEIKAQLQRLYDEVYQLYQAEACPDQYAALIDRINEYRKYLRQLENQWREAASRTNTLEGYGLWHAPETTLEQLIIDYGSQDYVYLIPPEVAGIRVSIASNLPIPRASWSEMLELILTQNGVGIRTLNPYLRQLYLLQQDQSGVRMITNCRHDLEVLPPDARVGFVLSPDASEVRRAYLFLEKFINPVTTVLQVFGRDILLIGQVSDVQDLLKLYDFVASNRGDKEYKLVPISKVRAEEMARMLSAVFDQTLEMPSAPDGKGPRNPMLNADANGLKIISLEHMTQALFLVGTKEELRKAEDLIRSVEGQIGSARDKVVFWYTVKHSDPEELADILFRVYMLMITTGTAFDAPPGFPPGTPPGATQAVNIIDVDHPRAPPLPPVPLGPVPRGVRDTFYQEGGVVINPAPVGPAPLIERIPNQNRDNFIVDIKTGAIVMVVEADAVSKLKDLIRKLDVPKKMVQIETLLFEKRLDKKNNYGLNLLRLGDSALNQNFTGATFNNLGPIPNPLSPNSGVFQFLISRKRSDHGPAFDLAYRFLLSQDDVQINSSPSVLTLNQTPAQIAIEEEISINTGVFEFQTATGVPALKDAFTRAQYGITINITPIIHLASEEDSDVGYDYITLDSDITFDTIQPGTNPSRPDVTRRHITNQVQIPDGQTVVLGGLRRRVSNDSKDSIPFIGELPGFGKLFSETNMSDSTTEMFIFITPHIIHDPATQLDIMRCELLCRRPGDIPYFLECVEEAHRLEKNRLMEGGMTILFGPPPPRYYIPLGEYDGR